METLIAAEKSLPPLDDIEVPSRVVHLPLSWDDPATRLAIEKYAQSVRKDAPWCPSNIEFIRRINGLDSIEQVKEIVFSASYLVMGLGDVYLGAPGGNAARPAPPPGHHKIQPGPYLDPRERRRHRRRLFVVSMAWRVREDINLSVARCKCGTAGARPPDFPQPWLLRHFDQIRFYPVTAEELLQLREDFPQGKFKLQITEETFRLGEYRKFLSTISSDAAAFKARQQQAFEEERERWALAGSSEETSDIPVEDAAEPELDLPDNGHAVDAHVAANVWKIMAKPGEEVVEGETLLILEAMKMEIAIVAPVSGKVHAIRCAEGQMVMPGQTIAVVTT